MAHLEKVNPDAVEYFKAHHDIYEWNVYQRYSPHELIVVMMETKAR